MRQSLRLLALPICVLLLAAQRGDVARPEFLKTHSIWSAHDELYFQVRIEPHRSIRTVILEAWELEPEAEDDDLPMTPQRAALASTSVLDAEPEKRIYAFRWRAGLDAGRYVLDAKLYLGGGVHVASVPLLIRVQ